MTPVTGGLLAGAAVGGGVAVLLRGLCPAQPELSAALARLDPPPNRDVQRPGTGWRYELEASLGRWLADRVIRPAGGLRVPTGDLLVVDCPVPRFLLHKALLAMSGLLMPSVFALLAVLSGWQATPTIPLVVGLLLGAAGWLLPDITVRAKATGLRREFRSALGVYLDLVALERAADAGPAEALLRASTVGQGWAFRCINAALAHSRLSGTPPWSALAALGSELGVVELADLADIVALAGNDGAAIYETLVQKARSMRGAALATLKAEAVSASERMTVPTTILVFGFLLLAIYPAFARLQ